MTVINLKRTLSKHSKYYIDGTYVIIREWADGRKGQLAWRKTSN